ncbi:ubiquitin carboxyl-terminal hydrolase 3-like [Xenia sp. Carnegie-2017]|uniref:ubiquitin carboxyl-terminal hydrolase 3-like n=1 Tax=Xenia sp. Carnegie-2017 TaxID=2897299 RepID=UPI001F047EDE|nr:ubiquitin carboxyl-terminal hydrolase 3-like [Xenia sp. Carnegie-2017]
MECPHLEKAVKIDVAIMENLQRNLQSWCCSVCKTVNSPWVCLKCGVINCGRYVKAHAKAHYECNPSHCVCMDKNFAVFCYKCDEFVINDTKTGKIQQFRDILGRKSIRSPGKKRGLGDDVSHTASKLSKFDDQENLKRGEKQHYLAGLRNLGNTCFMNAVLQSLSNIQPFTCYFKELPAIDLRSEDACAKQRYYTRSFRMKSVDDVSLVEELRKILCALWQGQSGPISPETLFSVVWRVVPRFRGYQQQDAHEFMHYLLDRVHNELLLTKMACNGKNTIVTGIFGGLLESQVICSRCGNESRKHDPFLDLSLDIPEEYQSRRTRVFDGPVCHLKDCLDSFTKVEELQDSEQYYCPRCKKRQSSSKKLTILRLPNVLCLHLKRFKFVSFHRSKIDTTVEFPLQDLDMNDYVIPSVKGHGSCTYNLAAVIVHHGSGVNSGHYTSIAWHDGKWYNFNDSSVLPSDEKHVESVKGYIFFYTKSKPDNSIIEKLKPS